MNHSIAALTESTLTLVHSQSHDESGGIQPTFLISCNEKMENAPDNISRDGRMAEEYLGPDSQ